MTSSQRNSSCNKTTVFNKGTENADKGVIHIGGQTPPVSNLFLSEKEKNLQNKEKRIRKFNITDTAVVSFQQKKTKDINNLKTEKEIKRPYPFFSNKKRVNFQILGNHPM